MESDPLWRWTYGELSPKYAAPDGFSGSYSEFQLIVYFPVIVRSHLSHIIIFSAFAGSCFQQNSL